MGTPLSVRTVATIFICCLAVVCAHAAKEKKKENGESPQTPKPEMSDRVTLSMKDATLGAVVRRAGEVAGGRFAVMNGLETRPISSISFVKADFKPVALKLADKTDCAVQECPGYFFIFASGYESLTEFSLTGKLTPPLTKPVDRVAFGANLPLYAVFAWLGQSLNATIVGDNAVADAKCGELAIRDVSLDQVLEAVLKSARVAAVEVDSTAEYVFFQAKENLGGRSSLLNAETLAPEQRAALDRRVTVYLPKTPPTPGRFEIVIGARPLAEVLPSLSQQMGMLVVAERGLEDLPVNPAVFSEVTIRTAMDLLIRQWLAPEFGYQITHDRIVILRRASPGKP